MPAPKFKLTLEDANGLIVIAEGALSLILKLREILRRHAPDVTTEIHNLEADAAQTYRQDFDEANTWLEAHGFAKVEL